MQEDQIITLHHTPTTPNQNKNSAILFKKQQSHIKEYTKHNYISACNTYIPFYNFINFSYTLEDAPPQTKNYFHIVKFQIRSSIVGSSTILETFNPRILHYDTLRSLKLTQNVRFLDSKHLIRSINTKFNEKSSKKEFCKLPVFQKFVLKLDLYNHIYCRRVNKHLVMYILGHFVVIYDERNRKIVNQYSGILKLGDSEEFSFKKGDRLNKILDNEHLIIDLELILQTIVDIEGCGQFNELLEMLENKNYVETVILNKEKGLVQNIYLGKNQSGVVLQSIKFELPDDLRVNLESFKNAEFWKGQNCKDWIDQIQGNSVVNIDGGLGKIMNIVDFQDRVLIQIIHVYTSRKKKNSTVKSNKTFIYYVDTDSKNGEIIQIQKMKEFWNLKTAAPDISTGGLRIALTSNDSNTNEVFKIFSIHK